MRNLNKNIVCNTFYLSTTYFYLNSIPWNPIKPVLGSANIKLFDLQKQLVGFTECVLAMEIYIYITLN